MEGIKNIIFDLGGVFINIDFELTWKALAEVSGKSIDEVKSLSEDNKVYDKVERGEFTNEQFYTYLRNVLHSSATDEAMRDAWNALLLEIDVKKVELVKRLSKDYKLFVLSNTSKPHIDALNKSLREVHQINDLKDLFHKVYYSYDVALRKPSTEIYEYVLKDAQLNANETLFIDDNLDNLKGASRVGIQTLHVPHYNTEELI